jgi:hypothetical protein
VVVAWLASSLAGAACGPVPATELGSAAEQAVGAFTGAPDQFPTAADKTWSLVPCLSEAAPASLAVSLHTVRGMQLTVSGDDLGSQRALGAALRIEPSFALPEGASQLAPVFERAQLGSKGGPTTEIKLSGFVVQVDGKPATERPVDGPYLLQVLDPKGEVELTQYVGSGEEPAIPREVRALASANSSMQTYLPDLAVVSTPLAYTASRPVTEGFGSGSTSGPKTSRGGGGGGGGSGSKALLWSSVASGGLAAGMYGTAVASRLSYDRGPTPGGYVLTNGAFFGSVGTASLSGLLLTTFFLTK